MLEDHLTAKQAAQKFGLSDSHIRRLLENGKVQGTKVGNLWLIPNSAMEEYMANRPRPGRKPGWRKKT